MYGTMGRLYSARLPLTEKIDGVWGGGMMAEANLYWKVGVKVDHAIMAELAKGTFVGRENEGK